MNRCGSTRRHEISLDACFWGGANPALEAGGRDVVRVGDLAEDPGDDKIIAKARGDEDTLVMLDKDFGEIAIVRRVPHSEIIRLAAISARQRGPVSEHVLSIHGNELLRVAIATVEPGRLRIRPPDIGSMEP